MSRREPRRVLVELADQRIDRGRVEVGPGELVDRRHDADVRRRRLVGAAERRGQLARRSRCRRSGCATPAVRRTAGRSAGARSASRLHLRRPGTAPRTATGRPARWPRRPRSPARRVGAEGRADRQPDDRAERDLLRAQAEQPGERAGRRTDQPSGRPGDRPATQPSGAAIAALAAIRPERGDLAGAATELGSTRRWPRARPHRAPLRRAPTDDRADRSGSARPGRPARRRRRRCWLAVRSDPAPVTPVNLGDDLNLAAHHRQRTAPGPCCSPPAAAGRLMNTSGSRTPSANSSAARS